MAAYISKIQLPSGSQPYLIKDSEARTLINSLSNIVSGALVVCGETTTDIASNPTATPITLKNAVTIRGVEYAAGASYVPVAGDVFFYGQKEFVYDGTNWIEFGDITGLGELAYADQVSASYTPSGSVSAEFSGTSFSSTGTYTPVGQISANFSGTSFSSTGEYKPSGTVDAPVISLSSGTGGTTTIHNPTAKTVVATATQGSLPNLDMIVAGTDNETLSISWGAGSLPTFTSADSITTTNVTALSSVPAYTASAPAFTGISSTITVNGTATGSITDAAFMGDPGSVTVNGTATGSIVNAGFTGSPATIVSNPVTGS